ncbi:signal peptidase I [Citricoccus sp. SGAir0253]|uniref:signal peptidase I n=1 Tax=Citricoccus sp. SGAir0253 TaxID=2567881 RepID=UPI0010CD18C9|nr:signal peptidase I [Citricoccus sp. SGAir0253]QCU78336.1 signal peptidase I [Citricoccus sp. SGAir0253]
MGQEYTRRAQDAPDGPEDTRATLEGGGTAGATGDPAAPAPTGTPAAAPAAARPAARPSVGRRAWLAVREIVLIVLITILASFLVKTFLFRAYYIPSGSMEQTLQVNDRIFVNLLVPGPFGVDRGDVIVFQDTKGWLGEPAPQPANGAQQALEFIGLLPDSSEQHLVKRIIGMPGDTVECCSADGRVVVNGEPVDEPYLHPGSAPSDIPFTVTVPEGHVWVMGDHRDASADSRMHRDGPGGGFIDLDDVTGRAEVIAWPVSRWGDAGGDREAFADVPDPAAARAAGAGAG